MKLNKLLTISLVFVFVVFSFTTINATEDMFKVEDPNEGLNGYGLPKMEKPLNEQYNPFQKQTPLTYTIPVTIENQYGLKTIKGLRLYLVYGSYLLEEEKADKNVIIPLSNKIGIKYDLEKLKELTEGEDITPLEKIIKNGKVIYFNIQTIN